MKTIKILALFLIFSILLTPISFSEKTMTLVKLFVKMNEPNMTYLKRAEVVEQLLGTRVKGYGRVIEVNRTLGGEYDAVVRLRRHFRDRIYRIILPTDVDSAIKLREKQWVRFEGTFVKLISPGIVHFDDVKIEPKGWLSF